VAAVVAACGRIGFDARPGAGGGDGAIDTGDALALPIAQPGASSIVDVAGIGSTGNEADGTHVVFVDNTPGKNGNVVIFRQGDSAATIKVYVSTDHGATWSLHTLTPAGTAALNVMGVCQDSINHAFHVVPLDSVNGDEYIRVQPIYSGGDISGFATPTTYQYYNDGVDSPGSRDVSEVVDANGVHRLMFAGTGSAGGSTGLYKLAATTVAGGVAPPTWNTWVNATDHTIATGDDQLVPNNYATGDRQATFMIALGSNLAGGPTSPVVILAGFPVDKKLLMWLIRPASSSNFTISAPITVSTTFGGGTGVRADASLSLVSAPSGHTWFVYAEDSSSPQPGLHVKDVDPQGVMSELPQPTTSTQARHAVIATDSMSRASILYADGSGGIVGTLFWAPTSAWLPIAPVATESTPASAWSITNVWPQPGGHDAFGYYRDNGAATSTTFSQVWWQ
jgi:hypothetical protein